jgi:DNA-binding NtrC family response regulator
MPAKILVVDDESIIRDLLYEFLTSQGYTVLLASSGEEALKFLSDREIKLALVDLKLPGLDGLELIQSIKKFKPSLPCLLMTAYPDKKSLVRARKLGVSAYITKPFQLDQLLSLIQKALK